MKVPKVWVRGESPGTLRKMATWNKTPRGGGTLDEGEEPEEEEEA